MDKYLERMIADMVIAGVSERTREACARAVRQLVEFYNGRTPDQLGEDEVKAYLLWMRVEKEAAPGTLRIAIGGGTLLRPDKLAETSYLRTPYGF